MTKKDMIYFYNKVRIRREMALNGALNYYTISQLETLCRRVGKRDAIPYIEAFMLLHQEKKKPEECHLTMQGSKRKPKGN